MKNIYIILLIIISTYSSKASNTGTSPEDYATLNEVFACLPVDLFYATNVTFNSADIGWNPSPEAIEYVVSYRLLSDTAWSAVSVSAEDSLASIYDLVICKPYEFYITTVCSDFTELESVKDTFFTLCDSISNGIFTNIDYNDLILYPNPTTGEINIQLEKPAYGAVIIRIYNSAGTLQDERSYILNGEDELNHVAFLKWVDGLNYVSISFNNQINVKQVLVYK